MSENDPFSCFGDDDEEEDVDQTHAESSDMGTPEVVTTRDPSCGILAFHAGTEQALLKHVELGLGKRQREQTDDVGDLATFVLDSIDDFCLKRHWMMHVGNEKAIIIQQFVEECCSASKKPDRPLLFVELGTYCGYSSIMFAKTLRDAGRQFHFYSVEVVVQNARVAKELIQIAGFEDNIDVLILDPDKESLVSLLNRTIKKGPQADETIDFLFIDHDKSLYLSDLRQLEGSGWIKAGCFVAADNVVFARIDDYRQHMNSLASKGQVRTRLEESWLEYCQPDFDVDEAKTDLLLDGIGTLHRSLKIRLWPGLSHSMYPHFVFITELSVYLDCPPFM